MPLQTGSVLPSGVTFRHQPRNGTLDLYDSLKQRRDPHVAFCIRLRAEGKLVIVVEAPRVADRFKLIRPVIAIAICHPRHFRLLRDPETSVAKAEPEHLIEAAGKLMKGRFGISLKSSVDQPDFAPPRANRQPAVREHLEAAALEREFLWKGHIHDPVIRLFTLRGAPVFTERLRCNGS